jgi:glucan endo-1,3-alpha-glucosidase
MVHLPLVLSIIILSFYSLSSFAKHTDWDFLSLRHSYPAFRERVRRSAHRAASIRNDFGTLQRRDGSKYVFMHHIVGNTYDYTQDSWAADFTAISAKGIDAVALNVGADSWQKDRVTDAYAAASSSSIQLFISFDYTSFSCDVDTTVAYVQAFRENTAQFKVDGRPMISSFSGDCLGANGWQEVRNQTGGYLMPFIYDEVDQNLATGSSYGFLDSWFCWGCAWPQGNYNISTGDDQYYINLLGNRYATTISGWFYTHYSSKNRYLRGDDWLIISRWEQLVSIRDQLTFIEMATWNDYGESNYFGPVISDAQPAGTTWATGFPHTGFFDLSAYYITAFKTGEYPQITEDTIYFWSRPHPAAAVATQDSLAQPDGWDWTSDTLWAAAFCSSTCSVTLQVGDQSQDFNNLPSGVNKISLSLTAYGSVTVKMSKNGEEVINYTADDFQYQQSTETYNFNAYVGSASASSN